MSNVKLTKDQKFWLEIAFGSFLERERLDYRKARAIFYDKLSKDFNPNSISSNLLISGIITPQGIKIVKPEYDIYNKIDNVIELLKHRVLKNPSDYSIPIHEFIEESDYEIGELEWLLTYLNTITDYDFRVTVKNINNQYSKSLDIDSSLFDLILRYGSYTDLKKSKNDDKPLFLRGRKIVETPFSTEASSQLNPIFKSKIDRVDKMLCFVLMPFNEKWSDRVYKKLIKPTFEGFGIQCLRADNINGPIIIEDIWIKINQSALIIADATNRNPNVMYELGIAHTVGKPSIIITQEINKTPFDFAHLRQYEYSDDIDGFEKLREKLEEVILEIYRENYPDVSITKII